MFLPSDANPALRKLNCKVWLGSTPSAFNILRADHKSLNEIRNRNQYLKRQNTGTYCD